MKATQSDENPEYSLVDAFRDNLRTANSSWSETDKLYVSVCSALIAAAAIFGDKGAEPPLTVTFIGVLLLILAVNWWRLTDRYRGKIGSALEGLAKKLGDNDETGRHFKQEHERFSADRSDYRIVGIVGVLAVLVIIYPIGHRIITHFF